MKTLAQRRRARIDLRFGQKMDDAIAAGAQRGLIRIPAHLVEAAARIRQRRKVA